MSKDQQFNQFTIAHQLQNRVRVIVPSLCQNKERATILQILLLKRSAVEQVKVVPAINSITIFFDSAQLPKENLLNLLDCVLANFPKNPRESIQEHDSLSKNRGQQDVVFGVKGMSCESCALFIEMVLAKGAKNQFISVNYKSGIGAIRGYLTKAEIFKIIEDNGYQPYSLDPVVEERLLMSYKNRTAFLSIRSLCLVGVPLAVLGFILLKK